MADDVLLCRDHILATVTWSKSNEVTAVWMNRVQNMFIIQAQQVEETAVPEKVRF